MVKLTEKHIEVISKTVLEYLEKEKEKDRKRKQDWRLKNTKLLLRNYRKFKIHAGELEEEISLLDDEELLDSLDSDEFALESIKNSKKRTLAMIHFIDKMLEVYRVLSEKSTEPEEYRKYRTIYLLYINDERKTIEEIAECHNVNVRTVYRDRNGGVETLASLIFGVDSIRFID